jgi:hypothetical protein
MIPRPVRTQDRRGPGRRRLRQGQSGRPIPRAQAVPAAGGIGDYPFKLVEFVESCNECQHLIAHNPVSRFRFRHKECPLTISRSEDVAAAGLAAGRANSEPKALRGYATRRHGMVEREEHFREATVIAFGSQFRLGFRLDEFKLSFSI